MSGIAGRHQLDPISIGIVDENEIFRRGLVACLSSDESVTVAFHAATITEGAAVSLIIASPEAAATAHFEVPVVVCTDAALAERVREVNSVMGVLPRAALKPAQLMAGVRAAASGLQVNLLETSHASILSARNVEVLRMLAQGAATRQISDQLGYSERTIKHAVSEILEELGARSRAEAVAMGIRRGLI